MSNAKAYKQIKNMANTDTEVQICQELQISQTGQGSAEPASDAKKCDEALAGGASRLLPTVLASLVESRKSFTRTLRKQQTTARLMRTHERAAGSESSKLHDLPVEMPLGHDRLSRIRKKEPSMKHQHELQMTACKAPPCRGDERTCCPQAAQ